MSDVNLTDLPTSVIGFVRRGDELVISRQQTSHSADVDGPAILPPSVRPDAGKTLTVDAEGERAWANAEARYQLVKLFGVAAGSTQGLPLDTKHTMTGHLFSSYIGVALEASTSATGGAVEFLPAVLFSGITGDRALGNTYDFELPPTGWAQLIITSDNTFVLNAGGPANTEIKILALYGAQV